MQQHRRVAGLDGVRVRMTAELGGARRAKQHSIVLGFLVYMGGFAW